LKQKGLESYMLEKHEKPLNKLRKKLNKRNSLWHEQGYIYKNYANDNYSIQESLDLHDVRDVLINKGNHYD